MIRRSAADSVTPAALAVGMPGRVKSPWRGSYRLGEPCIIPLTLAGPGIETRVFLKHDGIFYAEPFGDWAVRTEIHFLPEAPGAYTVLVEWRDSAGATGWTEAAFVLGPEDANPSPRLVSIDRRTRLWVPSAWESRIAAVHEKAALALAATMIRKDAVIYDIGANLGLYSILLSRIAGPGSQVYCVEANPVALYFLQANLGLNRVPRFEILPLAILGTATTTEFRINYRNLLVGIAGPLSQLGKPGHVIGVSAVPLDELIDHHNLRPPDFIKMDIEGAEVHAMAGMRQTIARHRPAILMELHGQAAARGTLDAIDWEGYSFQEVSGGRTFATAADLRAWFPDACLQVLARPD
jgi:FkbM family methyltransferase